MKSDEPNSRYLVTAIFWDQIWPNLGLNDGLVREKTGKHTTKLHRSKGLVSFNIGYPVGPDFEKKFVPLTGIPYVTNGTFEDTFSEILIYLHMVAT